MTFHRFGSSSKLDPVLSDALDEIEANKHWDAVHVTSRWDRYMPLIFVLVFAAVTWALATGIEIAHAMAALGTWPGL